MRGVETQAQVCFWFIVTKEGNYEGPFLNEHLIFLMLHGPNKID